MPSCPAPRTPPPRALTRFAPLAAVAVLALSGPPAADALTGTAASPPTFPKPATEKVQPAGGVSVPSVPVKTSTPAAPTTTYAPQSSAPGTSTATPAAPAGAVRTSATATSKRTAHSSKLSTAALALAILGALLVLICLAWALARARAYDPHWARSLRHSLAEGGFRASATWAEFSDWARIGK